MIDCWNKILAVAVNFPQEDLNLSEMFSGSQASHERGSCSSLRVELGGHRDTCEAGLRWWGDSKTTNMALPLWQLFWCCMSQHKKAGAFGKAGVHVYPGHSCAVLQHGSTRELWEKSVTFHGGRSCQGRKFRLRTLSSPCSLWMLFAQSGIWFSFFSLHPLKD